MEESIEHREGTPDVLQDHEGDELNHSAHSQVEEIDQDENKRARIFAFLNACLLLLDKVEILHRFLLKDPSKNGETIDLGDLASDVLTIPSSFFSDTLGGGATPTVQLTGLAKFEDICNAVNEIELISPSDESIEECLNYAGITEEQLVQKNRFRLHKIKAVINTTVKGDTGGLLIDKLLHYRRDQQWSLQSNALWVYAHSQPEEYNGINEVCRKPYEDAIGGIIRVTLQRTKDGQRVRQALDDTAAFATRLLAKKSGQVTITAQEDEYNKTDYNCKSLETYVVLSLEEHMRNLATLQKNIFNVTKMICDSIGASSRNVVGIINTIQTGDDDSKITSLLEKIRVRLSKIEAKWCGTVYESLLKETSKVNQSDNKILEKGPEDLLPCVSSLVDNTFVLKSKTRVINSMRPLSGKVSTPLLCFSEKLHNIMCRAHTEQTDFLTETTKFTELYRDVRIELLRKFGGHFAHHTNGVSDSTAPPVIASGNAEIISRSSGGSRAASTSPSMGRRQQFFQSSGGTDGKSPTSSPRGTVVGSNKPSPRNGKSNSSSQTPSLRNSPRTPGGSPRVDVVDDTQKAGSVTKVVAPPQDAQKQGSGAKAGVSPQVREGGSTRRKAMANSRRSGPIDPSSFEPPAVAPEHVLAGNGAGAFK